MRRGEQPTTILRLSPFFLMCNEKSYIFGATCNDSCGFKFGSLAMTILMSGGRRILLIYISDRFSILLC
ncbi:MULTISPECIES: hypothetical protein [Okeania]|uniref:hypothetical protein n=1 Tax=Okeania TaxID=1458928 RepID=UPI000F52026B|nr:MULTISPECIES: hypothetical protein [Okeania]NET19251.1 hypothetical protein [Okeania sp. SIO1H5]NET74894.1 hypothetical protein [Okeania sp. SIO1F9]NET93477.1 hypothetical protein [Okeania sp. SIO1H2]